MHIVKNGDVHVSAPVGISRRAVEAFINQHLDWITEARQKSAERLRRQEVFYGRLPVKTRAEKIEAAERLDSLVGPMLEKYTEIMGVRPSAISYKPMTSRWGVCNIKKRSICYSSYLLLLPEWCIEHVVVHELCHLLEPSHNARFHALMDKYYPRWKQARRETRRIVAGSGK